MRILQVVHGYPPRYNAGSEVYTQTLSRSLANTHDVMVFSRFEDPFLQPYVQTVEYDVANDGKKRIPIRMLNLGNFRDRYRHDEVDAAFDQCLEEFNADIVHIQHLSHLSTSLVMAAAAKKVPIVFTLHDFWLMCPRGQFIQFFDKERRDVLPLCDGQEDRKCAERCYSRNFSGGSANEERDVEYYSAWVHRRMAHMRELCGLVNLFIAPSRHLRDRFVSEFRLPAEKTICLDYGFDLTRLQNRNRLPDESRQFVFGYIGTHVPAKGIHHLLQAFVCLNRDARLRIWGRPSEATPALMNLYRSLPATVRDRISWEGEYANERIVSDVFNHVDAIVVPSIWLENSPLVIHEAQQVRIPVITADAGGMAEFVRHEENGLLFRHRDPSSLAIQMARLIDDSNLRERLGARGYLFDTAGSVPSIDRHTVEIETLYRQLMQESAALVEVSR